MTTISDPAGPADPAAECRYFQEAIRPAARVLFCGRCGHATGGTTGHYVRWCLRDRASGDGHFCCPASCERRDGPDLDPVAPCHPAPGTYDDWAEAEEVRREALRRGPEAPGRAGPVATTSGADA